MNEWSIGERVSPLGAATMRQALEVQLARDPPAVAARLNFDTLGSQPRGHYLRCLGLLLRSATTCLWKEEIWCAATARADSFSYTPLVIPDEEGNEFWTWDTGPRSVPTALHEAFKLDRQCMLTAAVVIRSHKEIQALRGRAGVVIVLFFHPAVQQPGNADDIVPRLRAFPALAAGDPCIPAAAPFFAAQEFMRQPFVGVEQEHIERHERKRFEKKHGRPPAVNTVLIRRAERQGAGSEASGLRDYGCQWMVNGHWRKPNARMREPRPVYVRPYVKGPDNKPFKPPRHTVLLVGR